MVCSGIAFHCHTPLVCIVGTLDSQHYISETVCSTYVSPIENVWSMLAQRLARDTPPTASPDQLRQYVEAAWTAVSQGYIQSLSGSMPRLVAAAVIANNGGYIG
ncbi:transposable element Tcb1 transposase [Trichonephila clavipes]|uniref:Transposable element Tcb1 transposase n=1 Tax=Trichonephila clavipes TaxID=2585209 RepID=A0A8X6VZS3_TRICX|nr:transposable element Tcb1 transposase [Trichonephila clavipes]